MLAALDESRRALGTTSPNPAVGAVVVRDGRIAGRGHTQPPGGPHAEVLALQEAGDAARGAALYVTLEPCSHHGRTPPCVDAIVAAGVSEVHYAIPDPDRQVDGDGDRRLREAGLHVEAGDGAQEAAQVLAGYLKQRRTGMPLVVVKFAVSLDGRIAAASGDSRWVAGPEARDWAHRELRTTLDGILVGSNTVIVDNPELTARPGGSMDGAHQPLRIVLDSRGRIPADARALQPNHASPPTLVATTEESSPGWRKSIESTGAGVVVLPARDDGRSGRHLDLEALLRHLGEHGLLSLMVEGGGGVLGSFFDQRLVDHLYAVIAPVVIGAAGSPGPVAGLGAEFMRDAPRLRDVRVDRLGDDTLISGVPAWPDATIEAIEGGR